MSALHQAGRWLGIAAALLIAVLATGCAHPISLAPNLEKVTGTGKARVEKKVGLAITEADRAREVVTPGGGGDKVNYFPYRDMEPGLYVALSESFAQVTRVTGVNDPKVKSDGLNYVVTPALVTTSHSPSIATWPPTIFTVEITCSVVDADGKTVTQVRAFGDGRAEFDEFKSDPSLSARRAVEDALRKLVAAFAEAAPRLR
jgi:hypothetical protein